MPSSQSNCIKDPDPTLSSKEQDSLHFGSTASENETADSFPARESVTDTSCAASRENSFYELQSQKKSLRDFKCSFKGFSESSYSLPDVHTPDDFAPPLQNLDLDGAELSISQLQMNYSWSATPSISDIPSQVSVTSPNDAKTPTSLYKSLHKTRMQQSEIHLNSHSNFPSQDLSFYDNYSWSKESEHPDSVRNTTPRLNMTFPSEPSYPHFTSHEFLCPDLTTPRLDTKYSWSKDSPSPASMNNLETPRASSDSKPPSQLKIQPSNASFLSNSSFISMPGSASFLDHKYSWSKDTADSNAAGSTRKYSWSKDTAEPSRQNIMGRSFEVQEDGSFLAESWNGGSIYE